MYRSSPEYYPAPRRGNLTIPLILFVALIACVAGAIALPMLSGVWVGYQQLQEENHENAIRHYQRSLGYLKENYPDLALAELQIALRYDGSYEPARQKLAELLAQAARQQTPSGTSSGGGIAGKLLDEARLYVGQKQWKDAIVRLEQLRGLDKNYQSSSVTDLLFQSYAESGKEATAAGQIELARERFDAALVLRKDPQVTRLRDLAVLYLDGQQAAGYDLPTAIQKFSALYQQDPNYPDVKKRLSDASLQYGDRAAKENAWCLAAREYERASVVISDTQTTQKYAQAITRCKQAAVATPTLAASASVTATLTAGTEDYIPLRNSSTDQPCTGNGDISGTLQDSLGNPLVGFYVGYGYEGDNITRMSRPTDTKGQYILDLGREAAPLRVFVLGGDGKTPAGFIVNVQYPGGMNPRCHIVVNWRKVH